MRTVFVMNLTGSVLFLIYLIVKKIFGRKLSYAWYYRILQINILAFLIPMNLLGNIYMTLIFDIKYYLFGIRSSEVTLYTPESKLLFIGEDGFHLSYGLKLEFIFFAAFLLFAFTALLYFFVKTRKKGTGLRSIIRKKIFLVDDTFDSIKGSLGIKRTVTLLACSKESQISTIGIFHPIVLYCEPVHTQENNYLDQFQEISRKKFILTHELYHVKRFDVLWRVFSYLAIIVFAFNPLVWLLRREFEGICELSCDEYVLTGKEPEQKRIYAHSLINGSFEETSGIPRGIVSWRKQIKGVINERIEGAIMSHNRLNKKIAGFIAVLAVGLSSITTLAYDEINYPQEENHEYYEDDNEGIWGIEIPAEVSMRYENLNLTIYDGKYVYDQEGDIYQYDEFIDGYVEGTAYPNIICFFHNYQTVTYYEHHLSSNGGCEVCYYTEKVCSKCGKKKDRKLENIQTYTTCPH